MAIDDGAMARLSGAYKRYGAVTALDGLDLDVRRGELLAVLGHVVNIFITILGMSKLSKS